MALQSVKKRPIDILVGNEGKFNMSKDRYSIEKEVHNTGVKLYG